VECVHSSRDDDSRGTGQVVRVFVCRLFLVISLRSDDLFFFFLRFVLRVHLWLSSGERTRTISDRPSLMDHILHSSPWRRRKTIFMVETLRISNTIGVIDSVALFRPSHGRRDQVGTL